MTTRRPVLKTAGSILTALLIFTGDTAAQTFKTIHAFRGYLDDGSYPYYGGVTVGSGGVLYGTTLLGGSANQGTVFSLTPPASPGGPWTEAVYSFPGGGHGAHPYGGLAIGKSGVLYGVTGRGGASTTACGTTSPPNGCGTVFSLTPPTSPGGAWTEKVLYSFSGGSDGAFPVAGLTIGAGGVLYGTTTNGGASTTVCGVGPPSGCGTVFSLTPPSLPGGAWTQSVLYSFTDSPDGASPVANVVIGSGGVLYGTTPSGGPLNQGIVFSLTPPASPGGSWTETVLYNFTGGDDGSSPSGVVIGTGEVLYGTTPTCNCGNGTVFSLTPPISPGGAWTEATLYNFPNATVGSFPEGGVVIGIGGVLYGTAQ
jgi:uncharacterized repeat protein (TIGR03803 family)